MMTVHMIVFDMRHDLLVSIRALAQVCVFDNNADGARLALNRVHPALVSTCVAMVYGRCCCWRRRGISSWRHGRCARRRARRSPSNPAPTASFFDAEGRATPLAVVASFYSGHQAVGGAPSAVWPRKAVQATASGCALIEAIGGKCSRTLADDLRGTAGARCKGHRSIWIVHVWCISNKKEAP
jgi:hypothetical protein